MYAGDSILDRALHVLYSLAMAAGALGLGYLANVVVLARTAEVVSTTTGMWFAAGFALVVFISTLFGWANEAF